MRSYSLAPLSKRWIYPQERNRLFYRGQEGQYSGCNGLITGLEYSKGIAGARWIDVGAMGLIVFSLWFDVKSKSYETYILIISTPCGSTSPTERAEYTILGHFKRVQTVDHRIR